MKKHLFFWASLLVAGLALTACGDDADDFSDKTTPVAPTGKQKWTVTVGAGVMTRGLNDDLTPKWSADDEVYVYYGSTKVGTLKPTVASDDGSVTLTGELDEAKYSTKSGSNTLNLRYKYGATGDFSETPNYSGQKGTIEDIADRFDYMNATVTIDNVDNTAKTLTTSTANFQNLQSIFELRITEPLIEGDYIEVCAFEFQDEVIVTPDAAVATGTPIYAAVPLSSSPSSYEMYFNICHGVSDVYRVQDWSVKSLQNGKHYTGTLNVYAVKLWAGGPWWAVKNVGASDKYDVGSLFAWGETVAKTTYSGWTDYKYGNPPTKYNSTDNLTTLELTDDAAYVNWGENWRMPKWSEFQALIDNTTHSWDSSNNGYWFTGNTSDDYTGHSIFLTRSTYGDYWSSTLDKDGSRICAFALYFDDGDVYQESADRFQIYPIRPVYRF